MKASQWYVFDYWVTSTLCSFPGHCCPCMGTDLLLPSLKQITVVQEERLHLVDAAWCHKDEVEDGKDTQLQVERAIPDFPKREAAEESCENVQVDLVPDVIL